MQALGPPVAKKATEVVTTAVEAAGKVAATKVEDAIKDTTTTAIKSAAPCVADGIQALCKQPAHII